MPVTLDGLSFDVLFYISAFLDFDDIIHLGHTCRQLKTLLDEGTLCRRAVEADCSYSNEAQLAQNGKVSYTEAFKSIYDRRDAFSNAYPFSARVLGQGTSFLHHEGVLCILNGSTISISGVHVSSESLQLDITSILCSDSDSASRLSAEARITLLSFNDDIVTIHHERKARPNNGRILAISTKLNPPAQKRIIREITLRSSYKLFARHTSQYLYYGTYTGDGLHSRHEWKIYGVSLDPDYQLCELSDAHPLQLHAFFGNDIGSTVCFDIFGEYFYALSNQTSFEVEELDWTSFYHCVRFPLAKPIHLEMDINTRIYRRQHAEGPIHDSWTDLSLQLDERTNFPLIVETRREWQRGTSRQLRTYYVTNIDFDRGNALDTPLEDGSTALDTTTAPLLPLDDPFTTLLDSTNNPNYAPPQTRFNSDFHPEFPPGCRNTRSFILARTKFRAYNYSCSSFLDLVEDDRCCNNPLTGPCLRIRIGSRRHAPMKERLDDKLVLSERKIISLPVEEGDVAYRHSAIKMWPPPASTCPCSKRLHEILNPKLPLGPGYNKIVTGALDERSLIYMVKAAKAYSPVEDHTLGSIILIDFSRSFPSPSPISGAKHHEDQAHNALDIAQWQWMPGHQRHCREGSCR